MKNLDYCILHISNLMLYFVDLILLFYDDDLNVYEEIVGFVLLGLNNNSFFLNSLLLLRNWLQKFLLFKNNEFINLDLYIYNYMYILEILIGFFNIENCNYFMRKYCKKKIKMSKIFYSINRFFKIFINFICNIFIFFKPNDVITTFFRKMWSSCCSSITFFLSMYTFLKPVRH